MTEFIIYPTYKEFFDRILKRLEQDYVLTSKLPIGVPVCIGENPLPEKSGLKRLLPYHEERAVVCVGAIDNGKHLFAVNQKRLESIGGKLGDISI
jgi:hypothetical protein